MHSCRRCVTNLAPEEHAEVVREESEAYLRKTAIQQEWSDDDPALQVLWLPRRGAPPLPQYAAEPSYLDPNHCRLCLEAVGEGGLQTHLASAHQIMSMQAYRAEVLTRTLAEWPQQITAQVLRSRLAAFTTELSDENFKELPCASCARQKRVCKLRAVSFPTGVEATAPAWLPWNDLEWQIHRGSWCDQMHEIFSTDRYLQRFFPSRGETRGSHNGDPTTRRPRARCAWWKQD